MISDHPIIKKIAWTSGTRRAGASMETHREYVGYLDEWDGTERLTDEEIVRCRDCRYFEQDYTDGTYFGETVCWSWDNGHDYPHFTYPNGFCHRGKRRDA